MRTALFCSLLLIILLGLYGMGNSSEHARKQDVAAVANAQYRAECGSCHLAYPPGLLPGRSWEKLLQQLADHFGENAEVQEEVRQALQSYLQNNAADRVDYQKSRKMVASIPAGQTPLRISEIPYFRHEHGENKEVKVYGSGEKLSLARCEQCHPLAEQGSFHEHELRLPGKGAANRP
ncbi:MAG: diheme cytochrome c [Magnetococcales bacterium]|nr:diheme cytochrome c [Magnetococcales bacterium]